MRDRSPIWIAMADLLLCVLAIVIAAVNPKSEAKGIERKADYIITAEWPIESLDADVDLWAIPPPGDVPVYYRNREVGLTMLDQDCLGKSNSSVTLADGTVIATKTCRETMTLRGVVPGKYDLAINLYSLNDGLGRPAPGNADGLGVKVHVEIVRLNPTVKVMFQSDLTLDRPRQTINFASFELTADNEFKLQPPPLDPITDKFLAPQ
jgi:hypothetical protein